jgi:hypothetical protein
VDRGKAGAVFKAEQRYGFTTPCKKEWKAAYFPGGGHTVKNHSNAVDIVNGVSNRSSARDSR